MLWDRMTKNKVKSHFFQQLSTDAGFGECGCQAHLYLICRDLVSFPSRTFPYALQPPCQALGPSSATTDTRISQHKNHQYSEHWESNAHAFSWSPEADKLFQNTLSLRQVPSTGLLNYESLANLQVNRNRSLWWKVSESTP